ncbi:MAG: PLP-dependent decarboxylase, partial [bacterium]|nr:PLP-dependent decarboxylase [bacterium]
MTVSDMTPKDLAAAGADLIRWVTGFRETIRDLPLTARPEAPALQELLPSSAPETGEKWETIFGDFEQLVMPRITHWNHPRNFGYFNSSGSGPGLLGEALSAALNVNAMTWLASPAATELEEIMLDWVRQALGLPDPYRGVIYDGGSVSTFHALAAARERALEVRHRGLHAAAPGAIYRSAHAHSSIDKGVIASGMGLNSVREAPVDTAWRIDPAALDSMIAKDLEEGVVPVAVVATAGTTSSAAIDPLHAVAEVCAARGVWLHVDAAYGGSAAVVPSIRSKFRGWERADSITVNPHKWMFVPLDLSVLFVR